MPRKFNLNEKERIFLEGFKASGEAWNREWPFKGVNDENIWKELKETFQKVIGDKK